MTLISKAMRAALSAAFLLGATAPSYAQATPIGHGGGAFVAPNEVTRDFAFSVVQLPDGSIRGFGLSIGRFTQVKVMFDITSFMVIDDALVMAGPITRTRNANPAFAVGNTVAFAVKAGSSSAAEITGVRVIGGPGVTIQDLVEAVGLQAVRALINARLRPLIAGTITIH